MKTVLRNFASASAEAGTKSGLTSGDLSDARQADVEDSYQPVAISSEAPRAFYRSDYYCAEESVGYLMRSIVNRLGQDVERAMEPHGLTNAQWLPLLKLFLGKARTVAELAHECEIDAGSMTRLLDRIEAKGLCRRVRSSDDRRVVNLELTAGGRQAASHIPAVLCEAQNALLRGFTQEEWGMLQSLLARMLRTAQTNGPAAKRVK